MRAEDGAQLNLRERLTCRANVASDVANGRGAAETERAFSLLFIRIFMVRGLDGDWMREDVMRFSGLALYKDRFR